MLNFFNYIGGKKYMLKYILKLLDYSKYCYIELFGGSGKVLLNKPMHKVEIYNDRDGDIFNLWYVCKYKFDEFKKELDDLIYCEDLFKYFKNLKPENDVMRAVRTYYLFNCSISGIGDVFSTGYVRNQSLSLMNKIENLRNIFERIKYVQILNKDFRRILESIKNKDSVMLYADPPYYGTEHYYEGFSREDHVVLADYLNKAKYSVIVSYYYFDDIERLYPRGKWKYYEIISTKYSVVIRPTHENVQKTKAVELLLVNYNVKNNLNLGLIEEHD